MKLVKDNVLVEFVELGEGLCGDYDPDDPEDIELLRFDILSLVDDKWVAVDDASYCTLIPVDVSDAKKREYLEFIMDHVHEPVTSGYSIKKLCERLSWLGLEA